MESDIVTCPHCGQRNRVPAAAAGKPRCANRSPVLPDRCRRRRDFADLPRRPRFRSTCRPVAPWGRTVPHGESALEQIATYRARTTQTRQGRRDKAPAISQWFFTVHSVPTLRSLPGQICAARRRPLRCGAAQLAGSGASAAA